MTDPTEPGPVDDEPAGPTALLHRHRRLLGVLGLGWLGLLLAGALYLGELEARFGLHVFGPERWPAGRPSVIRIGLQDLQWKRFHPLGSVTATFALAEDPAGTRTAPQVVADPAGGFVQGPLTAPARAGHWRLHLRATAESGPLEAEIPVTIVDGPGRFTPVPPKKARTPPVPDQGPLRLDVFPADGVLPGSLPSALTVRATDAAGRPVAVPVDLRLERGRSGLALPSTVRTDRHGLATFPVLPMHPVFEMDLSAGDSRARRVVKDTATQFALSTPSPVVRPDAPLSLTVRSLHQEGPVFVDVWHGDAWLASTSATLVRGEARAAIRLPPLPADPTVVWVQAYRDAYLPGQARGGRNVLVTAGPPDAAIRWLAERLREAGVDADYMAAVAADPSAGGPILARFLLGRAGRPERDPPLLVDSSISAQAAVRARKERLTSTLLITLAAGAVVLFGVLALLLFLNYRQVERRWAAEGATDEALHGTRRRYFVGAAAMFAVLAFFLFGAVQLLLWLRW